MYSFFQLPQLACYISYTLMSTYWHVTYTIFTHHFCLWPVISIFKSIHRTCFKFSFWIVDLYAESSSLFLWPLGWLSEVRTRIWNLPAWGQNGRELGLTFALALPQILNFAHEWILLYRGLSFWDETNELQKDTREFTLYSVSSMRQWDCPDKEVQRSELSY